MSPYLVVIISSVGAAACVFGAFLALRRKRVINDLPTSKTQGVFIGLTELKSRAESESPFDACPIRCTMRTVCLENRGTLLKTGD